MQKGTKLSLFSVLVLVATFILVPKSEASFWIKGQGFYYAPDYGEFKDELLIHAPGFDVVAQLESGTGFALSAGYNFGNSWGMRLDAFRFTGKAEYHHLLLPEIFYFETSTFPILLGFVYRVLPESKLGYYLGASVGIFFSELTITAKMSRNVHYTGSSIGFQVLAGAEYKFKKFFFSSEIRYLSAKAEYPGYMALDSTSTDWSGLFMSIGLGYRFG